MIHIHTHKFNPADYIRNKLTNHKSSPYKSRDVSSECCGVFAAREGGSSRQREGREGEGGHCLRLDWGDCLYCFHSLHLLVWGATDIFQFELILSEISWFGF